LVRTIRVKSYLCAGRPVHNSVAKKAGPAIFVNVPAPKSPTNPSALLWTCCWPCIVRWPASMRLSSRAHSPSPCSIATSCSLSRTRSGLLFRRRG